MVFECRYDNCEYSSESSQSRNIHESHAHGSVWTGEWDNEDNLRQQYLKEGKSIEEISEANGVAYNLVRSRIQDHNIETRETNKTRYFDRRKNLQENREEIIQRYEKDGIALYELAEEYGVNDATIKRHLKQWGVETRDISRQLHRTMENRFDVITDREKMDQLYNEQRMSMREISEETGRSLPVVSYWLREHDFDIRDRIESTKDVQKRDLEATLSTHESNSYTYIQCGEHTVRHHRLLATLLVDELDELAGMHVHHISEVEWDNRVSNLEVLTVGKHLNHHNPRVDYERA